MNIGTIITVFMILVALTNILVNVIKGVFPIKRPKLLVLIVALLLALIVAVGAGLYLQLTIWYLWAGLILAAIAVGGLIAYVAMYGYDQGYDDFVDLIKRLIGYINGGGGMNA